ncbi:MAG: EAL domain-containing protein [Armatimonadetes bacterium]|nr:EAL domain-containing protein [Armatimonadota bacterium]
MSEQAQDSDLGQVSIDAEARALRAEARLQQAEARAREAEERAREAELVAREANERIRRLHPESVRARQLDEATAELQARLKQTEELRHQAEQRAAHELERAGVRMREAEAELSAAHQRVRESEERHRQADEKMAETHVKLRTYEEKLLVVEPLLQETRDRLARLSQETADSLESAHRRAREAQDQLDSLKKETAEQRRQAEDRVREAEERARKAEDRLIRVLGSASPVVSSAGQEEASVILEERVRRLESRLGVAEERARQAELRLFERERGRVADSPGGLRAVEFFAERARQYEEQLKEADRRCRRLEDRLLMSGHGSADREDASGVAPTAREMKAERRAREAQEQARETVRVVMQETEVRLRELQVRLSVAEKRASEATQALSEAEMRATRAQAALAAREAAPSAPATPVSPGTVEEELRDAQAEKEFAEERARRAEQRALDAQNRMLDAEKVIVAAQQTAREAESRVKDLEDSQRRAHGETERLAFEDSLTLLPNYNILRKFLDLTVQKVQRKEVTASALLVDLDRFGPLNDTIGREAGDELLRQVAGRLQGLVGGSDVVARSGEDKFVMVISVPTNMNDPLKPNNASALARNVAGRVMAALASPFEVAGQPIAVSATIGVSNCPGDADTAQEMLAHSTRAVQDGKKLGRGRCHYFSPDLGQQHEHRFRMQTELRKAVEHEEIEVSFRPLVELPRGLMAGAFTVLEWKHPQWGGIEADIFEELSEETGLILPIGYAALEEACGLLRRLKSGMVWVTMSTRQILDPQLSERFTRIISQARVRSEGLVIELKQRAFEEQPEQADRVVGQLSQWGVRVALGGLGSDAIPIKRLQNPRIGYVRISDAVVQGVPHDEKASGLCKTLVAMASHLGVVCVGSGADSQTQAQFLAAHGCPMALGNYFSGATSADELLTLKRKTWRI